MIENECGRWGAGIKPFSAKVPANAGGKRGST